LTHTSRKIYFSHMSDSVVDMTKYKLDQAEQDLRTKLVEYTERPEIQSQFGEAFYIWRDDPDFLADDITEDEVDDLTFEKFFDWFLFDFRLLDTEERIIERFYKDERGTLTELEDKMIGEWRENVYSFFEVLEVVPGESCAIRDLFDNKSYTVRDTSSSKKLKASDIIGARPLGTGELSYFSGVISVYPATFREIIIEFFNSGFGDYRRERGKQSSKREYLKDYGFQIGHYLEDFVKHPRFVSPEGEELVLASATYSIGDEEAVLRKLRGDKAFEELSAPVDEIKIFAFEDADDHAASGTLEIENSSLRVQCYSRHMLVRVKARIEKDLGKLVSHREDILKNLENFISNKETKIVKKSPKKGRKLPTGVKNNKELDRELDDFYALWLDQPHPTLGGKTPREAAASSEEKAALLHILGELESYYSRAVERGEPYFDVAKIKKQLNLK